MSKAIWHDACPEDADRLPGDMMVLAKISDGSFVYGSVECLNWNPRSGTHGVVRFCVGGFWVFSEAEQRAARDALRDLGQLPCDLGDRLLIGVPQYGHHQAVLGVDGERAGEVERGLKSGRRGLCTKWKYLARIC